jgi:YVTN family beta-propeller protein
MQSPLGVVSSGALMNYRFVLALLLFTTACSRADAPPPARELSAAAPAIPAGPKVFVTNEVGGDITVVDVGTQRVIATIPVGKRPRGIAASPDNSLLYVALSGTPIGGPNVDEDTLPAADRKADGIGVVSVRDLKLLRVIPGGSDPEVAAVSADGRRLFVANEDVGEATAIDSADGRVLGTFKVGGEPEGVNIRPDGREVYVTSEEDNQVAVIDADGLKLVATIPVGPRPRSTAFLPDSSRAYVPAENAGSISVIDTARHRVIQTITLEGGPLVRPMGVVVSPDGAYLFATTGRGKHVVIVDTKTNMQVGAVEVGERPWGIAISPDGKTVFTANGPSNDMSIVDVEGRKVVAKVKAGDRPWGIAYVP